MANIINDIHVRSYALNMIHCSIDHECVIENSKNSKKVPLCFCCICCICCERTFHVEATTPLPTSPFCFLSFGRSELCRSHLCCSLQRSRIPWMLCLAQRDQVLIVPGWTTGQWLFTRFQQSLNTSHKLNFQKLALNCSDAKLGKNFLPFNFSQEKLPALFKVNTSATDTLSCCNNAATLEAWQLTWRAWLRDPDTVTHGKQ